MQAHGRRLSQHRRGATRASCFASSDHAIVRCMNYSPMTIAQHLLVELGECFCSAATRPLGAMDEHLTQAARPILSVLNRLEDEQREDIAMLLEAARDASSGASHIEGAKSQLGEDMTLEDLPEILVEFCVAYFIASKHGEDVPGLRSLQTSTHILLEALSGDPALPEHVEEVFPFETALSDV